MDKDTLEYIITHVFCLLRLPSEDDHAWANDFQLLAAVHDAVDVYTGLTGATQTEWPRIKTMLVSLAGAIQSAKLDINSVIAMLSMQPGDVRTFFIRAQNAAVVFRKQEESTLYTAFEVSPEAGAVITTRGKLIRSFPGPAINIPNTVFDAPFFRTELANFLVRMYEDVLSGPGATSMEGSDTADPRYIIELLTGILRGVGQPATTVVRITKRIGDDVVGSRLPWRRSSLWLVVRVVFQTTLESYPQGHDAYKEFMIYFLTRLAEEAVRLDLCSDLLHFMLSKISRRLRKLGPSTSEWLSNLVLDTCSRVRYLLDTRWEQVKAVQHVPLLRAFSKLDLANDIQLSLLSSRKYLSNRLSNHDNTRFVPFRPDHHARGSLRDFLSVDDTFFKGPFHADPFLVLYDVEKAVEGGIDAWVTGAMDMDQASTKLESLLRKYSSAALKMYSDNPEQLSTMLLTTMELWVALDVIATQKIPLLHEFSPEIPVAFMEKLLLRKGSQICRLQRLHRYLHRRHSRSKSESSVFSSDISEETFSVRYFNQSSHLKRLKGRIEEAAKGEVERKIVELEKANDQHTRLGREVEALPHSSLASSDGILHYSVGCNRCELESSLNSMKIDVYEWPLPEDELRAAVVVFELDCPITFNMWRAATFHFLVDICSKCSRGARSHSLSDYPELRPYFVKHPASRISLGFSTPPTGSRGVPLPATKEQVLVPSSLKFFLADTRTHVPVEKALTGISIDRFCVYKLQAGPYQNLQLWVDSTSHTSNDVLANQAYCHKDLSVHEFISFGHLRSGGLLQWLNVLRELRDRSLSFRCVDVHFLLARATTEIGLLKSGELKWHEELSGASFGAALVNELETLVGDIEGNWLEGVTMNTISFLLGRLLASEPDDDTTERAVELLRSVRTKVFAWVIELSDKVMRTPGDNELRDLLRDTAAICRSTFDVDLRMIQHLLWSAEDVKVFVICAILLHDNKSTKATSLSLYPRLLLDRDCRLSVALEHTLSSLIQADTSDEGINEAVRKVWPDYRPGSKWTPLPDPDSRWFLCTTASTTSQSAQVVQFNVLNGLLLVDGKPLGRLPHAITQHSLYIDIFGEQVLDVIPSDIPGMDYSTRGLISKHRVYFTLRGKDLVIRAKQMTTRYSEIIELIPRHKLENDIPAVLIKGHVHWLNLTTSVMEIRPMDQRWQYSSENWNVDCTPGKYRMYKGHIHLVDVHSQTWTIISGLLKPLDDPKNLIITVSPADTKKPSSSLQLSVSLPRYGLSFYVDEDKDLQSHNMRGMVYDSDQSIGTFIGLKNMLVFRPKALAREFIPRCVLIPEGLVSFRTNANGHHVDVEIDTHEESTLQRLTYQLYKVDTDIGCLTGNVSLTNKLYRAYLHALTSSGYSTDPLTGRSGTEEALAILRSAGCMSIMKVSPRDAELLRSIASLCPARSFHHRNKNTQVIDWLDLPIRSQSHQLYLAAKAIRDHCKKIQLFHDGWSAELLQELPAHDDVLFRRSWLRTMYLLPSEVSEKRVNYDVVYLSRDILTSDSAEHRCYVAATTVFKGSLDTAAITVTDIPALSAKWKGILNSNVPLSLTYDSSWLNPQLSTLWIKLYNLCRNATSQDQYKLLFSIPAMVYGSPGLANIVPTLLAFAIDPLFRSENPPSHFGFDLSDGYEPTREAVFRCVQSSAKELWLCPENSIPATWNETTRKLKNRRLRAYNARIDKDSRAVIAQVQASWPSADPPVTTLGEESYDLAGLRNGLRALYDSCNWNILLREHLFRVKAILFNLTSRAQPSPAFSSPYTFDPARDIRFRTPWSLTLTQLMFTRPAPLLTAREPSLRFAVAAEAIASFSGTSDLFRLISNIGGDSKDIFQHQYASDLHASATHFLEQERPSPSIRQIAIEELSDEAIKLIVDDYEDRGSRVMEGLVELRTILGPIGASDHALEKSGQWPCITLDAIFRCISSTSPIKLADPWKKYIIRLVILMLEFQRSRRLLRLVVEGPLEELYREFTENVGFDGWDPEAEPDWLLIQLQGDFLVRRVQVEVANEMVSPSSEANTAMQLNMGEGKSSVIVPISVAKLADGNQLVRVVIPKALTAQMFQILVDRLGGLVNRKVYYLPFSRSLSLDPVRLSVLQSLMLECMQDRGVLVVQPDHVLSLMLVSVEKQLTNVKEIAGPLLGLQRWLHSHARDLVDESDEILHVRYQLVYTVGFQQPMEGSPERWTTTQQVLSLVKKQASSLQSMFKEGVEYEEGPPGSFPYIRLLQLDAATTLVSQIARDVINGYIPNLNFQQLNSSARVAIFDFITEKDVSPTTCKIVEDYTKQSALWSGLLLLRGILATGVLLFAFRDQRWRVDYGLAPNRTMLAVPYRAKDVPAPKAEFGHPDVAIVLTCLSYYYGGLTEDQLKISFQILLKQDDPSVEYEQWVRGCSAVPISLQSYTGVNLKSSEQWSTLLVPLFSRNHGTIDFFLERVVFPTEAKEFPSKLACSGWDLAEKKDRLVTGFSGTNDGRYLLPLHITQHDPAHQRGTNAKVLSYLLQPESDYYMCTTHENGERRTTVEFLQMLVAQQPEIRVLLDVGAQMLDLQNQKLAEEWLTLDTSASAAIYFNEDDELAVVTRDGSTQLLLSSPFAEQLDQCVIYLDDAHTRGTDIKFPSGFRAAVTLGPKVTKDRLVQGCMRMRKLGKSHSLMFFAPLEVERKIRSLAHKDLGGDIHTIDILRWAINETCDDIQQRALHWAQQGTNHQARYDAWTMFCAGELTSEQLLSEWLQPEVKSLEELYAPRSALSSTIFTVPEIRERCINLGIPMHLAETLNEEQEREVIHEVEREQEVERPPMASPAQHSLSGEVTKFIKTGAIPENSDVFRPVFTTLYNTSAITKEPHVWSRWVLATQDFCETIAPSQEVALSKMDEYLRPVQWIVSHQTTLEPVLVILSPYEVNRLLPIIRKSEAVHLHLYTPRTTKSMKPTDALNLYNIPETPIRWSPPHELMSQLNIFAGQLYLSDREAYSQLCRFLCVVTPDVQDEDEDDVVVECDGFIARRGSLKEKPRRMFQYTPLPFIKVLFGLRRKGMSFTQTHMGKVLEGRLLWEKDFERREDDRRRPVTYFVLCNTAHYIATHYKCVTMSVLPPELWVCIIDHATYVPGTLEPDIYAIHGGLVDAKYSKGPLRAALVTKRALVLVCKQWWHLAIPFLYRSVYIGRARSLSSLSRTLARSAANGGVLVPLGKYVQRLDIAMRDHSLDPEADYDSLDSIVASMPHLSIVSYAASESFFQSGYRCLGHVPDILQRCAASLRVLDWSSRAEPYIDQTVNLLVRCTQLRILHWRTLIFPKDYERSIIPPTLTTLRVHAYLPPGEYSINTNAYSLRAGSSALRELILNFYATLPWENVILTYSSQLVSVHFYIMGSSMIDVSGAFQTLAEACPLLRRFTITSNPSFFLRSHPVFPAVTYLGLRSTRAQTSKAMFEGLFTSLEELRSRVPSLRVIQLLNDKHVQYLLKTYTEFAARRLLLFMGVGSIRIEDSDGVLLTDRLKALRRLPS